MGVTPQDDAVELPAQLTWKIRQEALGIVDELIKKAREGSCQHAKFLFELAGLTSADGVPPQEAAAPLMQELLENFETSPHANDSAKANGRRIE